MSNFAKWGESILSLEVNAQTSRWVVARDCAEWKMNGPEREDIYLGRYSPRLPGRRTRPEHYPRCDH
jgi:hypothetical protein